MDLVKTRFDYVIPFDCCKDNHESQKMFGAVLIKENHKLMYLLR